MTRIRALAWSLREWLWEELPPLLVRDILESRFEIEEEDDPPDDDDAIR